jgi:hypothetical protein
MILGMENMRSLKSLARPGSSCFDDSLKTTLLHNLAVQTPLDFQIGDRLDLLFVYECRSDRAGTVKGFRITPL